MCDVQGLNEAYEYTITIHSLNQDKSKYPGQVIGLCKVRQILNVVNMMRPRRR